MYCFKDELIPELQYKLNFDSSINKYISSITSEIIIIYVNEVYNPIFLFILF